jgi:hypothetical protein
MRYHFLTHVEYYAYASEICGIRVKRKSDLRKDENDCRSTRPDLRDVDATRVL